MTIEKIVTYVVLALLCAMPLWAGSYSDGDALQLQTYTVTDGIRPDVSDGAIAAAADPDDWLAAYVRVAQMVNVTDDDTTDFTILFGADSDTLYISAVGYLPNASELNELFIYFDQNNNGALDAGPGEYYLAIQANGSAPVDGHWNGSTWVVNPTKNPGLSGFGLRKGSGGSRLYNFECKVPLKTSGDASNSYLDLASGDEPALQFEIKMNTGSSYFWDGTNKSNALAAAGEWGELFLPSNQVSGREVAALFAKSYTPTIDGDITGDDNWKFAFEKTITFSDFAGNKLSNSKLLLKESGGGDLYIGVSVATDPNNTGDYIQVYFDQDNAGGPLDYILSTADDAARVAGDDTYGDYYFNGTIWTTDGASHGSGAAKAVGSTNWEFEISKPINSGDANDLQISSEDSVGILLRYFDADNSRSYFWSATINKDDIIIDPIDGTYNALGWGKLYTGGPFVQPLYPEQNDIISGTYQLMLYAEDQNGVLGIDSVDYRITDLNDNVIIDYASSTRLTKIDNNSSGVWVTTFNSNTGSTPDGDYNVVFRVLDDDGIRVSVPVRITISNSGTIGGPTISNVSLGSGDVISGDYRLTFDVSPSSGNSLVGDSILVSLDGGTWTKVDSIPALTGGTAMDTIATTGWVDGVHTLRIRAKDDADQAWGYSELIIFNVDNQGTAPIVTITGPSTGAVQSGTMAIDFTVTPHSGRIIDSCEISVDGFNWKKTATNSSDTILTTAYEDGTHIIQVRAYDNNNRIGISEPASFIFKNSPTVTLTAPTAGTTITGTTTASFTVTPSAPATITKREVYVDGALLAESTTETTYLWNTVSLTDGAHTLQIRATDSDGRVGMSEIISVQTFNTPVVAITAPSVEEVLTGLDTVLFSTTLPAGVTATTAEISFNGGSWQATTTLALSQWNTSDFPDGSHTVQVRVTGSNGKVGSSPMLHYRVQNAPAVTVVNPAAGEAINRSYTVLFRATTPTLQSTIVKREISIDGGTWDTTGVGDSTYTLITTGMENGAHDVSFRVTDNFGRSTMSLHRSFHVDNEAPLTADPKVLYPDQNSIGKSSSAILITALVQDNIVGLAETNGVVLTSDAITKTGLTTVVMVDDGSAGDLVAGDNVFTAAVTVATDSSGAIGFTITATDRLGNSKAVTSSVLLDNIAPTIDSLDFHPDLEAQVAKTGNSYNERIILRGGYSDAGGSGIGRAVIEMKNSDGDYVNNSPIELSIEDSLFSRILVLVPGSNQIVFTLFDKAGNSVSDTSTITYIEPKATKEVNENGGTLASQNGVSVVIPAGALLNEEEITITRVPAIELAEPEDERIKLLGVAHEFGPDGSTFRKPVTVTLTYTEADLDRDMDGIQDVDPTKFGLVFWDGESWQNAGKATIDTVNRRISVVVNHFTVYDIAELDLAPPTELIYYWSKNPVKVSDGSYFNYRVPSAGTVSLKILDLAGDIVYQIIADETPVDTGYHSVEWRGQNVAERFAGPGIYVTLFTYTPTGGTKEIIRKPLGLLK